MWQYSMLCLIDLFELHEDTIFLLFTLDISVECVWVCKKFDKLAACESMNWGIQFWKYELMHAVLMESGMIIICSWRQQTLCSFFLGIETLPKRIFLNTFNHRLYSCIVCMYCVYVCVCMYVCYVSEIMYNIEMGFAILRFVVKNMFRSSVFCIVYLLACVTWKVFGWVVIRAWALPHVHNCVDVFCMSFEINLWKYRKIVLFTVMTVHDHFIKKSNLKNTKLNWIFIYFISTSINTACTSS
jgi:hypothetical protein